MASLKSCFRKRPGAWEVAKPFEDGALYLQGARWEQPDTIVPPAVGVPMVLARLGKGQVVGVTQGGVYAVDPPTSP